MIKNYLEDFMQDIHERLGNNFIEARYGYWIHPEGSFINVEKTEGHIDAIMDRLEFITLSPTQPLHVWYDEALARGFVRIIAKNDDTRQMNIQFKTLGGQTRRALLSLIQGLEPRDLYVFEARDYKTFDNQRDVVRFVREFNGVSALTTETWSR
jgi:hypothetical protein